MCASVYCGCCLVWYLRLIGFVWYSFLVWVFDCCILLSCLVCWCVCVCGFGVFCCLLFVLIWGCRGFVDLVFLFCCLVDIVNTSMVGLILVLLIIRCLGYSCILFCFEVWVLYLLPYVCGWFVGFYLLLTVCLLVVWLICLRTLLLCFLLFWSFDWWFCLTLFGLIVVGILRLCVWFWV